MKKSKSGYIHRRIEDTLKKRARQFAAVALTGPRQSGKSTLLRNVFGGSYSVVSFDDPVTRERALSDPRLFMENAGERIIFDEVQYAPQILSYVKILIDGARQRRGRFIITGSQQFSLMKNIGDTLAGRVALLDLLPFSVEEKRSVSSLAKGLRDPKSCFVHSCLRGSFPEVVTRPGMDASAWYGSYLQTYLERDVRTIHNVGVLREFQQFMRLLAARCSQIMNLSSFAGDLGVSVNTIKHWLSILEASRVVYVLPPYYRNLGKRVTKSPKAYFLDIGLVCYLTGIRTPEQLFGGPLGGALFENFVVQETVKHFFNKGERPDLFYLRTHNGVEVDLLVERNQKLLPFEIKLTRTPNAGMAAPMERFREIFDGLAIGPGKVICLAEDGMALSRNVSVAGLDSYLAGLP
jgi:predicted AAA+ superfamily ATPase